MSPFRPGRRVRIRTSHGIVEWHGDEGEIEKLVPFNKAYVLLERSGRQIVDLNDCRITRAPVRRTRRKQTREQRRALATVLLIQRAYVDASGRKKREIGTWMSQIVKAANKIDALTVWDVSP